MDYKKLFDRVFPFSKEKGVNTKLKPGMVIAIEPMLCEGSGRVVFEDDGYTVRTADGKRSAHFEHTVVATTKGSLIIT